MSSASQPLIGLIQTASTEGVHGVVVLDGPVRVAEAYFSGFDERWGVPIGEVTFAPDVLHDLRSVTKSIVSLLYGIAYEEGLVPGPDSGLLESYPHLTSIGSWLEQLRIEHALTMTLGLDWNEDPPYSSAANDEVAMELADDRIRFVLQKPRIASPGLHYRYCGGATAILGDLICRGSGLGLDDYANEKLFRPLGIDNFEWVKGVDGVCSAASGLRLTPRGLAAIGALVKRGGMHEARRLLSSDWIEASTRARFTVSADTKFGYHWKRQEILPGRSWIVATGNGGQRLFVDPAGDLVIAITAGKYNDPNNGVVPTRLAIDIARAYIEHAGKPGAAG